MNQTQAGIDPRTDVRINSAPRARVTTPLASAACVAFALLFFAGDIKGSQELAWIPFDLTAGVFVVVIVLSALNFLARDGKIRTQVVWMLSLFLVISTAVIWTEWTPYALDKAVRLFSLALLSAVLPAFILPRIDQVRIFVSSIIVSGLLISAGGLVQLAQGVSSSDQITGINSNTISLGRNAGIALVGLYVSVLYGSKHRIWLAVFFVPLLLVLVASGSRGPALFAAGVIVLVTARWSLRSARATTTAFGFLAIASLTLFFNAASLPQGSVQRIQGFIQQQYDSSSEERVLAGKAAIDGIGTSPLGLGIGGFARIYNFGTITDRIYPHNVVLEMTVEHGWVAGILFVFIILLGVSRAHLAANREPKLRPFFAVLLFALGNSFVSGDLNDNKIIYALLCIALIAPELQAANFIEF